MQIPWDADRLNLRTGEVSVIGTLPGFEAQTHAIIHGADGQAARHGTAIDRGEPGIDHRVIKVSEIFRAAARLEQAYARAGYVLVRVALPEQHLVDNGPVTIRVINGAIDAIELRSADGSPAPAAVHDTLYGTIAPLIGRTGLKLGDIERRLLLAGDIPGVQLRSVLMPSANPDNTVLVITATYQPVTGFVSYDGTMSQKLGGYALGFGLNANAPTGHGEQVYLRANGYPNGGGDGFAGPNPLNRSLAGGVVVPIGHGGLTFNFEVTEARTTPEASSGALYFTSDFTRYASRLRYPVVRSRDLTINTELDFDVDEDRDASLSPVETPLSLDRLRVVRPVLDGVAALQNDRGDDLGLLNFRLAGANGINALGARGPAQTVQAVPLTRQGEKPDFSKLEMAFSYTYAFNPPEGLAFLPAMTMTAAGQAQDSFGEVMPLSEQIGLAAPSGLSGFPTGTLQGDSGYVMRFELGLPIEGKAHNARFIPDGMGRIAPYVFGAAGATYLKRPTVLEHSAVHADSYGLGLRLGAAHEHTLTDFGLTLEWGRAVASDRPGTADRLSLTMLLSF